MIITLNILLGLAIAYLLLGVSAERDAEWRKDLTITLVAILLFTIALNTIM